MQSIVGSSSSVEELTNILVGAGDDIQIAMNHWAQRQESRGSSGSTSPSFDEISPLERVINEVGEEIQCDLCLQYYDNPVSLFCLHTFCLSCVEGIVFEDEVVCPTCQAVTPLEDGASALTQNHYLANIVDMIKNAPTRKCGNCKKLPVSAFCKKCRKFLCTDCDEMIHSEVNNSNHRVRKIGLDRREPVSRNFVEF